jgi:copper transport protein
VLHFSAAAVWFGGVVLLGTCMLPRPDVAMLQAVSRFSSVAFMAMVGIVVTGMMQSWRQVGACRPWGTPPTVACWWQGGGVPAADRGRRPQPGAGPANADGKGLGRRESSSDTKRPDLSDDADNGSLWLLRRLVLAEVIIAVVVLAVTALLGIATPPRAA